MNKDVFIYRVDDTDTITSVSDNWGDFAEGNAWSGFLRPDDVVGRTLWDFIQDRETRHLYQELFKRARAGVPSRSIPFRCDSPSERRYLELLIVSLPDHQIEITSKILRTEPHSPMNLLKADTPRSKDYVTICSMCKKLKLAPEQWAEIEDGLVHLRLFEADEMPQLTHGLCQSCYQVALGELEILKTASKAIDNDKK
jgi:hypothetical protein